MTALLRGRSADERWLRMLELRSAGHKPKEVAQALGAEIGTVLNVTRAVRRADEEQAAKSGEDLTGAYWPEKSGSFKRRAGK